MLKFLGIILATTLIVPGVILVDFNNFKINTTVANRFLDLIVQMRPAFDLICGGVTTCIQTTFLLNKMYYILLVLNRITQ